MINEIKSEFRRSDLEVITHEDYLMWFNMKKDDKKVAAFRIILERDENKNITKINVLKTGKFKYFKKDYQKIMNRLQTRIKKQQKTLKNTPVRESTTLTSSWSIRTQSFPLFFTVFYSLLFLFLNHFIPSGKEISLVLILLSGMMGFVLGVSHHWGAGAPFPEFHKVLRIVRIKYVVSSLLYALIPFLIINLIIF